MLVRKYVDENGLAAMLAAKRSVGVTPEVNLREHTSCMPLQCVNKASHSGFESPQSGHVSTKIFLKKKHFHIIQGNPFHRGLGSIGPLSL